MTDVEARQDHGRAVEQPVVVAAKPVTRPVRAPRFRNASLLITLGTTAVAALFGWAMWKTYMQTPWTRDGVVRTYVVTMAPEVAGRIVELPVIDNEFVHRDDLLLVIDPTDYKVAVQLSEAAVRQARADTENVAAQITVQQAQVGASQAQVESAQAALKNTQESLALAQRQVSSLKAQLGAAEANVARAEAQLRQAQVNLGRTRIGSPVNGWVTNLLVQLGDYATVGRSVLSVVNADSFWVDAYFEETQLASIHEGDPAKIKLMGYSDIVRGTVAGTARGINVANARADEQGLATVNPIFTWVRLAQRVPVRIRIDHVPDGVRLVAGTTATVQVDPDRSRR